jgi:hypothetical protein
MYKASELLGSAKGQSWWQKERFRDFEDSAQFDRHARGRFESMDLNRRMDIDVARNFIRDVARRWLDWWIKDESAARAASQSNVAERRTPRGKKRS